MIKNIGVKAAGFLILLNLVSLKAAFAAAEKPVFAIYNLKSQEGPEIVMRVDYDNTKKKLKM